jgi:hypothetical protein
VSRHIFIFEVESVWDVEPVWEMYRLWELVFRIESGDPM